MKKIVIAGAGFGGIRAALDLTRFLPEEKIILINGSPYHCYNADLYEVVSAVLPNERRIDFKNLSGTVNIPLSQIFRNKNLDILIDTITEIDLNKRTLSMQNSEALEYDFLVLALGSANNYYDIEDATEFSHPLKTTEDALNIRNDLEELVSGSNTTISVVIAGGGYTGVETAGQLASSLGFCVKILILEAAGNLLPGMPKWSQEAALKRLKRLGVEVKLNSTVRNISENRIYCGDSRIQFDYLIWTAGVIGADLNGQIKGVFFTNTRRVETKDDLSLEKYPNVFAIGDLAECPDKKRGCFVPATAWAAISEGSIAAKNILAKSKGEKNQNYSPPAPVFVVPVGRKYALSNFANFKITGSMGWFLKRIIALKYFLSILPFFEAISIWGKGVRIFANNKEFIK